VRAPKLARFNLSLVSEAPFLREPNHPDRAKRNPS